MIWDWMRFVFLLFLLSGLVACGGFGTQAEPTPVPVPSSTSSPIPTNTPEPTITPLPTDTPSPTSTPTITATPTPQIGETRINPETGQEEIYGDSGEWVKVVNAAEASDLETVTEANSEFITNEDGSITLRWTQDSDRYAEDFGEIFEYIYADPPENLIDPSGVPIEAELRTILDDRRPFPIMRMVSKNEFPENFVNFSSDPFVQEGEVAFWNYEEGSWTPIYSIARDSQGQPMVNLGTGVLQPWMPDIGLVEVRISTYDGGPLISDYIEGEFVGDITHHGIVLAIKPVRIINQKMISYWETVGNEVSWMEGVDEKGNIVRYPATIAGDPYTSGVFIDTEDTDPSYTYIPYRDPNTIAPLDMTREHGQRQLKMPIANTI